MSIVVARPGIIAASRRRGGGGGGGTPSFRNSSWNNTGSATSLALSKPTGTSAGDFLVLIARHGDGGSPGAPFQTPTGFTQLVNVSFGSGFMGVWYRIADGTEGSTFTVTRTGAFAAPFMVACSCYQGGVTSLDTSSQNTGGGSGTTSFPATALTTVQNNEMLVYTMGTSGFADPSGGFTPPGGYTERIDGIYDSSGWKAIYIADALQASAGSSGTPAATGPAASFYVTLVAIKI